MTTNGILALATTICFIAFVGCILFGIFTTSWQFIAAGLFMALLAIMFGKALTMSISERK